MRLKWYGTATILLEQDGVQLLFDPFLSLNTNVGRSPTLDICSKKTKAVPRLEKR